MMKPLDICIPIVIIYAFKLSRFYFFGVVFGKVTALGSNPTSG